MTDSLTSTKHYTDRWELLEALVSAPGVAGREAPIRDLIRDHAERQGLFDEIEIDALGSLICRRSPRPKSGKAIDTPLKVLVTAHLDQIGFLVSHIEEGGFLRLHPVGSFDPRTLFARAVRVVTEAGDTLPGVLHPEGRPVHTAPADDLRKVPDLETFFVDLSLPEAEVRQRVRMGDMVVFASHFQRVGESIVAAGLDDRAGCWALLVAMEDLREHDCEIIAVFTSQEEVGSRGAKPVSFAIEPDIGIACDTTVCCALPGTSEQHRITQPGEGVSVQIADSSMISDQGLVQRFEAIGRDRSIKCQRSLMLGGGQDGGLIQGSRRGVVTIVLSCPVKYLHTATEMVHIDDLSSFRDLLSAALGEL